MCIAVYYIYCVCVCLWGCVNALFAPYFYASCSRACTKCCAVLTTLPTQHTQARIYCLQTQHLLASLGPPSSYTYYRCAAQHVQRAHTYTHTHCTSRRCTDVDVICTYRHAAKCSTCLQCETLDIMQYFLCSLRAIDGGASHRFVIVRRALFNNISRCIWITGIAFPPSRSINSGACCMFETRVLQQYLNRMTICGEWDEAYIHLHLNVIATTSNLHNPFTVLPADGNIN